MANNRLWAVCKDDNEAAIITKYYPSAEGWGSMNTWVNQDDFFNRHAACASNHGCGENILFVAEHDDPRVKEYDYRVKPVRIYFNG